MCKLFLLKNVWMKNVPANSFLRERVSFPQRIVGPRPERPVFVEKFSEEMPEFSYRLSVKAGITGYAQIYGKYNITSLDKLKLDLMYIRNQSFMIDLKIIILTMRTILTPSATEGFSVERSREINVSTRE